ncbi:MAG TPA: hypothetical protein VED18_09290 [Candidatus Sulfotelmatobacter sp.]|nr:hypothetical protein [Candidatus Sulfotelmatobacter sp.]
MAEQITGSLIDLLRRDRMHARDMAAVLESLRRRLAEEGIPFAVVGAIALRQYGVVRATEDIDIVTTPEGLTRIHETLVGRGIVPRGPGLRKRLRETEHVVNIDVITSGEHAGSQESPVVYPSPDSSTFVEIDGLRYPTLESLITFKIASGVWGRRDQDLVDIQKLIRCNGLTEAFAERLSPTLRETYLTLLQRSRLEIELE